MSPISSHPHLWIKFPVKTLIPPDQTLPYCGRGTWYIWCWCCRMVLSFIDVFPVFYQRTLEKTSEAHKARWDHGGGSTQVRTLLEIEFTDYHMLEMLFMILCILSHLIFKGNLRGSILFLFSFYRWDKWYTSKYLFRDKIVKCSIWDIYQDNSTPEPVLHTNIWA